MSELTLHRRVIAVPETRELDLFAGLLERRGAIVLRCPLVEIRDAPDPTPVLQWIERVNRGELDDLILLTGEGLRRLVGCIERHAPTMRDDFVSQLARLRKITRGPKPARALRELGLASNLAPELATTDGIIAALSTEDLRDRTVGVQLYGTEPNRKLIDFLERSGAKVHTVAPYVYADAADDAALVTLAKQLRDGTVDAIAFTSMQQVQRYFTVLGDELAAQSLRRTLVAAVGPIVADALANRGLRVDLQPEDAYFLKPLTRKLEERLGPKLA